MPVLRYGRSKVLILDNGSSFKNRNTNEIAGRLGTQIIYNPPYKPTSKAVIERFLPYNEGSIPAYTT